MIDNIPEFALIPLGAGAALLAIGLFSSMLHLGRPLRAWRAPAGCGAG